MNTFLHVGCGSKNKSMLKGFKTDDWKEIRFDINEDVKPDIKGTMTDMSVVEPESIDAVYSSHNIEHLYPHDVPIALSNFYKILKKDGFVVLTCPDLQTICEHVVSDKLTDPLYISPAGPIAPIDVLYGHRGFIAKGNSYMAHKCGFTYSTLIREFLKAGFAEYYGGRSKYSL
jgi:ubiquinone/menaquinone biosynthesis C-methylase UbiE